MKDIIRFPIIEGFHCFCFVEVGRVSVYLLLGFTMLVKLSFVDYDKAAGPWYGMINCLGDAHRFHFF